MNLIYPGEIMKCLHGYVARGRDGRTYRMMDPHPDVKDQGYIVGHHIAGKTSGILLHISECPTEAAALAVLRLMVS